jgi:hypothetical protein
MQIQRGKEVDREGLPIVIISKGKMANSQPFFVKKKGFLEIERFRRDICELLVKW